MLPEDPLTERVLLALVLGEPALVVAFAGSFDLAPGHVHDPLHRDLLPGSWTAGTLLRHRGQR
jgi:hypothetical protein